MTKMLKIATIVLATAFVVVGQAQAQFGPDTNSLMEQQLEQQRMQQLQDFVMQGQGLALQQQEMMQQQMQQQQLMQQLQQPMLPSLPGFGRMR